MYITATGFGSALATVHYDDPAEVTEDTGNSRRTDCELAPAQDPYMSPIFPPEHYFWFPLHPSIL